LQVRNQVERSAQDARGSLRSPFQQLLKHIRANPGCRTVGMSRYKDTQQDNRDHTAVKRYQNAAWEHWRGNRKSYNSDRFMRAFIELLPHEIQRPAPGMFSVTRLEPQFPQGGPLFVHDKVDIFF
jgi:hypothetical protein